MAITRKPQRTSSAHAVDIEALIGKGGTPAREPRHSARSTAAVVLRLPGDMLERVDSSVEARPVKIPRHTWILEAIVEKLDREQEESR